MNLAFKVWLRVNEYTPFCNGPGEVKSPRVIVTPLGSRFCPWSALRPPHDAVRGISYSSLIKPVPQSALPQSTGKLYRRPTCDAGSLRSCAPKRPSPASSPAA
jgi:hypothetical protein